MFLVWLAGAAVADEPVFLTGPPFLVRCELPVITPVAAQVGAPAHGRIWPSRVYETIPLVRSVEAVVALTPGVVPGPRGRFAGSPASEVGWYLDGLDVTDPVSGGSGPSGPPALRVPPPGR